MSGTSGSLGGVISCEFIVNAGTTIDPNDAASGQALLACGNPLHFWSSTSNILINVDANGSVDISYVPPEPAATAVVFASNNDPNTGGTAFYTDPEDIAGSGVAGGDTAAIYIAPNGSTWTWNGAQYITYVAPPATEWTFGGTTTDAGGNKTLPIARTGNVVIGTNTVVPSAKAYVWSDYGGANRYAVYGRTIGPGSGVDYGGLFIAAGSGARTAIVGVRGDATPAAGTSATSSVMGGYFRTITNGGAFASLYGSYSLVDGSGTAANAYGVYAGVSTNHTLSGSAFGGYFYCAPDAGHASGNRYGVYAAAIDGGTATVGGFLAGVYTVVDGAGVTGKTYGMYQTGTGAAAIQNYFRDQIGVNTTAPTALLSVNGTANKTGGGAWAVFSDARTKQNVARYPDGALDKIMQVRVVTFEYADAYREHLTAGVEQPVDKRGHPVGEPQAVRRIVEGLDDTHVGVIAQEIATVFPGTVRTKDTGFLQDQLEFDANELTFALVKAVQELAGKVAEQAARIEALTGGKKPARKAAPKAAPKVGTKAKAKPKAPVKAQARPKARKAA